MGCTPSKANRTTEITVISPISKPDVTSVKASVRSSPIRLTSAQLILPNATDISDVTNVTQSDTSDHVTGLSATRTVHGTSVLSWSRHVEMSEMSTAKRQSKHPADKVGYDITDSMLMADLMTSTGARDRPEEIPETEASTGETKTPANRSDRRLSRTTPERTEIGISTTDAWTTTRLLRDPCQVDADPERSPASEDSQYYSQEVESWSPHSTSLSSFASWNDIPSEPSIREDTTGSVNSLRVDDDVVEGFPRVHQQVTRLSRPNAAFRRRNERRIEVSLPLTARF